MGEPISFRLQGEADNAFRKKADERGVKESELAKEIILKSLEPGREFQDLRERILFVEKGVENLRTDIGLCVCLLLVGSKMLGEAEAKEWVKANLHTAS